MRVYCISTLEGSAKGKIVQKSNKTWTVHVELTPYGSSKIEGYLTQSGYTTRHQAEKAWDRMREKIELELIRLG